MAASINDRAVKVVFRLNKDSDGYPPVEVESLWAVPEDGHYRIDNIPFYASSVSLHDIVAAHEVNGLLEFDRVERASGNSTYRLVLFEGSLDEIRAEIRALGCETETDGVVVAINAPPGEPHLRLRGFLQKGFLARRFDFEESCLAEDVEPWDKPSP